MELLAPAASPEGLLAAVTNGANAVYLGMGELNARRGAKNFSAAEFSEAVTFCHARGVKVYVTLNTLTSDREMETAARYIDLINSSGADAVLVQDIGVLKLVRSLAPDLDIHASTQMTIHNAEGAALAASLGCTRVVAARELSLDSLRLLCNRSPIQIETFVHGALCFCWSGQCYMSSVIGGRSGNRGMCAQPCRLAYGFGERGDEYPLSLKDLTLAGHLQKLKDAGVACLKIEGRMRRPEYAAIVTRVFADALDSGIEPSADDMRVLELVFSRDGFTDGYITGRVGRDMLGVRREADRKQTAALFKNAKRGYESGVMAQNIGVRFACKIEAGVESRLAAEDADGNRVTVCGAVPQVAHSRALSAAEVTTQLYKTGGTPYRCDGAKAAVGEGLSLPLSEINALRRAALAELDVLRSTPVRRTVGDPPVLNSLLRRTDTPQPIVQVSRLDQVGRQLLSMNPHTIYLPLDAVNEPDRVREIAAVSQVAVVLPRVAPDTETDLVFASLDRARALNITTALVGNLGLVAPTLARGFKVRGDYSLNIFNSLALEELKILGLQSATLSFELSFAQIRDLRKPLDTEIIAYGRLPLMITEQCIVKNKYGKCNCGNNIQIVDRKQASFPIMRDSATTTTHRNLVLNSQKLWLADKSDELNGLGVGGLRLYFTTENARECAEVYARYAGHGDGYEPTGFTRGLYYRGVD